MRIQGLKVQGTGQNEISDGSCCPQSFTFEIWLNNGEQAKNITDIVWNDGTCGSLITDVAGNGYSSPLAPNFFLDAGFGCPVTVDLCGCGSPGSTFTIQMDVTFDFPVTATQTFWFDFLVVDIATAKVIDVTEANFWDCVNDCGKIENIVPINNPLDVPITVDFNDPVTGFSFYADGVLLTPSGGTYYLTIPPRTTVQLGVANVGCAVTSVTDFMLTFNYCGRSKNVDVYHKIVQCDDCGLYCDGIQVASVIRQDLIDDPTLDDPTQWLTQINFGNPTNTISGGKFTLLGGNIGAYNESALKYDTPITFNTATPQTFRYTIKTGRWQDINNSNLLYMYLPGGGWGGNIEIAGVPFLLPTIQPYSTYTGTFTINPWTAPAVGFGNGPILVVRVANQNGKYFDILEFDVKAETEVSGVNLDCSDLDTYTTSAIGDGKIVTYNLYYRNGFQDNTELFFNPKVFGTDCDFTNLLGPTSGVTVPNQGWKITVNSAWINDGLPHFMQLYGLGATGLTQQNLLVWVEFIDDYNFKIRFAFYMTMDVDDWIRNLTQNNSSRLLKNHWNNPTILLNNIQSVYNSDKSLCGMIVVRDVNIQIPIITGTIPYVCGTVKQAFFTARFWDLGLYNAVSEMQNPTWAFSRTVGAVDNLSTLEKTAVSFQIEYQNPVDNIVFWLFDASNTNNLIDFYSNYDSSRTAIVTNPAVGILNNDLHSPSVGPTLVAPDTYEVTCYINKAQNPSGDYYLGAICYSSTDGMVNSFLYHFDDVNNAPEVCCDLIINPLWGDYNKMNNSDCHSTAPKERFFHRLEILGGALQTCMVNDWGMDPSLYWHDFLTTCNVRVYQKVTNYPSPGKDAFFTHYDFTQTRNTSYPSNWPNNLPGAMWNLADGGGGFVSQFWLRSRYEANVQPIGVWWANQSTPFQWNNAGGASASWISINGINTDWSDKDIYFHYQFNFNLAWLPTSPGLQVNYIGLLHPCDFETNPQPFGNLLNPLTITGFNTLGSSVIGNQICSGVYDYLEVVVNGTVPDGTCMATIDFQPYGVNSIVEEENATPPTNPYFSPLSAVQIYDVQNFVGGTASFKIAMSQLPVGEYQICAIYIPY